MYVAISRVRSTQKSCMLENIEDSRMDDEKKKVKKFLEYAGQSRDVADPYYTGNFDDTYDDLKIGIEFLINNIENRK